MHGCVSMSFIIMTMVTLRDFHDVNRLGASRQPSHPSNNAFIGTQGVLLLQLQLLSSNLLPVKYQGPGVIAINTSGVSGDTNGVITLGDDVIFIILGVVGVGCLVTVRRQKDVVRHVATFLNLTVNGKTKAKKNSRVVDPDPVRSV